MFSGLKDFVLHKLTLRVGYIVAAFSSAQLISFASSEKVQAVMFEAGVTFTIHDPAKLKMYIAGIVMIGGEFIYHFMHTKFILPKVS